MSRKSTIKVCGVTVLVLLLLFCALGPGKWQYRTGLGWRIDHVVGYFGFTLMFWLAWQRGHSWSVEPSWAPQCCWRLCKLLLRIAIAILRAHYTEWLGLRLRLCVLISSPEHIGC
jgi:hypothetical protein